MNTPFLTISADEMRTLVRRRKRNNRILFLALSAFVVAMFVISFLHLAKESRMGSAAPEGIPIVDR